MHPLHPWSLWVHHRALPVPSLLLWPVLGLYRSDPVQPVPERDVHARPPGIRLPLLWTGDVRAENWTNSVHGLRSRDFLKSDRLIPSV